MVFGGHLSESAWSSFSGSISPRLPSKFCPSVSSASSIWPSAVAWSKAYDAFCVPFEVRADPRRVRRFYGSSLCFEASVHHFREY